MADTDIVMGDAQVFLVFYDEREEIGFVRTVIGFDLQERVPVITDELGVPIRAHTEKHDQQGEYLGMVTRYGDKKTDILVEDFVDAEDIKPIKQIYFTAVNRQKVWVSIEEIKGKSER